MVDFNTKSIIWYSADYSFQMTPSFELSIFAVPVVTDPKVLIEGVLFRARYLGSTQLVSFPAQFFIVAPQNLLPPQISPFVSPQNPKPNWCCLSWQKSANWECVSPRSKYSAVLSELMPYLGTGWFYHKRLIYQSFQSCWKLQFI